MNLRAVFGLGLVGVSVYLATRQKANASAAVYKPTGINNTETRPVITPYIRTEPATIFSEPREVSIMPIKTSGFKLSSRSLNNLRGVNPKMVAIVKRAIEITEIDFGVSEGLRTKERQSELVAEGKSWTMDSRHITGEAVDVFAWVNGGVSWDWSYYEKIAVAFKRAARELNTPIIWGGDWRVRDGVHFELVR